MKLTAKAAAIAIASSTTTTFVEAWTTSTTTTLSSSSSLPMSSWLPSHIATTIAGGGARTRTTRTTTTATSRLYSDSSSLNGIGSGSDNGNNDDDNNNLLKSKSDDDLVNGSYYPLPTEPQTPEPFLAVEGEEEEGVVLSMDSTASERETTAAEEEADYSAFSYFTETDDSTATAIPTNSMDENDDEDTKETDLTTTNTTPSAEEQPSSSSESIPFGFLSVDGNGSGGLMSRGVGTGGTDATLMMGDTASNKATPVDSGSVHLPETQELLRRSTLTEVSGNTVVRGTKLNSNDDDGGDGGGNVGVGTTINPSDKPVSIPTTPPDDTFSTALHVSNTELNGNTGSDITLSGASSSSSSSTKPSTITTTTNVIPTVLKRYVPPSPESTETSTTSSSSSSSLTSPTTLSRYTGTSTGGANHFPMQPVPKVKVRRYVPGQDDDIFKQTAKATGGRDAFSSEDPISTNHMLPVRKLKPYTKPQLKPTTAVALPPSAVAVSTTTTNTGAQGPIVASSGEPAAAAAVSAATTTTNPPSTKIVRVVSKDTTSTIPDADTAAKDRYCNEYTPPTSATLHLKTGLSVDTPVSLWQPRDKFLDH